MKRLEAACRRNDAAQIAVLADIEVSRAAEELRLEILPTADPEDFRQGICEFVAMGLAEVYEDERGIHFRLTDEMKAMIDARGALGRPQ
jgi:hypothetical protein